jgi:hypothetical protein
VHSRFWLRSRLRRRAVELALIDFCYLSVRTWHAQRPASQYVLDLRFVDPMLQLKRHVAWRWIAATAVLLALSVGAAWWIIASPEPWWQRDRLAAFATTILVMAGAVFVSTYRTTETLTVFSLNGRVRLLEFVGSLGMFRASRQFRHQLAAHLQIATRRRRSTRAGHLRDEMREHTRLREARVLSEDEYDAGKRRILAGHAVQR